MDEFRALSATLSFYLNFAGCENFIICKNFEIVRIRIQSYLIKSRTNSVSFLAKIFLWIDS